MDRGFYITLGCIRSTHIPVYQKKVLVYPPRKRERRREKELCALPRGFRFTRLSLRRSRRGLQLTLSAALKRPDGSAENGLKRAPFATAFYNVCRRTPAVCTLTAADNSPWPRGRALFGPAVSQCCFTRYQSAKIDANATEEKYVPD